jgi:BCD family chlorophyll transporter-like MFS transporter
MLVLAVGGIGASAGTAVMGSHAELGVTVAFVSFMLIGLGVGAAGTSLLALLAKRVEPGRRPAAATIVWIMMIAGFAITAGIAGSFLDPFTPLRLVAVTTVVAAIAVVVTMLALYRLESPGDANVAAEVSDSGEEENSFVVAVIEIWREAEARRFTVFVFVSMLAYSAQDLILEPFAGTVFGMTPGESTSLSGLQHAGVFLGMIMVALSGTLLRSAADHLRTWAIGGCIASAFALVGISISGFYPSSWPLHATVFVLGVANGAFAVAAIGSMMTLAGRGKSNREGLRMGVWGASQAIAFAIGGFIGTAAIDFTRGVIGDPSLAYAVVFGAEALMFLVAAMLAVRAIRRYPSVDKRRFAILGDVGLADFARDRS